ncbi:putative sporulation protein YtxC [Bacillus alkalicellulosilyticus]|uniref:putative sporulation protein YtxC n=1 Tax=Alkalihalobacterium alkalicellulosilyticum TaxID=1912214 RepID=UPI000995FCCA|nr:putative sporulation protein YtxC [Bacillus alkalicellulosilyticus]
MISIHFESHQDCQEIYSKLKSYMEMFLQIGLREITMDEKCELIQIDYDVEEKSFCDSFQPWLVSVLSEHVVTTREEQWLKEIIATIFYFSDEEEQKQILSIARSILEGDRNDLPAVSEHFSREHFLYEAFSNGIDIDTVFYYEPFLTFRLKEYGEMLIDCVEVAIDEYLLEQEYQNIVEGLRYYLQKSPTKQKIIHLVQEGNFHFYNEQLQEISREQKLYMLDKDLVYEGDLDIDEMVISPLVSMVPEQVHIYTDEIDNDVIVTIQTIFQERAFVHTRQLFQIPNSLQ